MYELLTPDTWAEKFESFERINLIRETNRNCDSCSSCKRLVPSRLHELHESKFPFVHVSNLSVRNFRIFLLMYPGSLTALTDRLVRSFCRALWCRLAETSGELIWCVCVYVCVPIDWIFVFTFSFVFYLLAWWYFICWHWSTSIEHVSIPYSGSFK